MPELATVLSSSIPVVSGISRLFGGSDDKQKKAASLARRNVRAQRAMSVLEPFSDQIDSSLWNRLQNQMVTAMQVGGNNPSIVQTILQAGRSFALAARDAINDTDAASIIEKRGGQPTWTGLQNSLSQAVDNAIASGVLRDRIPGSTGVSVYDLSASVEAQPLPGQISRPAPPIIAPRERGPVVIPQFEPFAVPQPFLVPQPEPFVVEIPGPERVVNVPQLVPVPTSQAPSGLAQPQTLMLLAVAGIALVAVLMSRR